MGQRGLEWRFQGGLGGGWAKKKFRLAIARHDPLEHTSNFYPVPNCLGSEVFRVRSVRRPPGGTWGTVNSQPAISNQQCRWTDALISASISVSRYIIASSYWSTYFQLCTLIHLQLFCYSIVYTSKMTNDRFFLLLWFHGVLCVEILLITFLDYIAYLELADFALFEVGINFVLFVFVCTLL